MTEIMWGEVQITDPMEDRTAALIADPDDLNLHGVQDIFEVNSVILRGEAEIAMKCAARNSRAVVGKWFISSMNCKTRCDACVMKSNVCVAITREIVVVPRSGEAKIGRVEFIAVPAQGIRYGTIRRCGEIAGPLPKNVDQGRGVVVNREEALIVPARRTVGPKDTDPAAKANRGDTILAWEPAVRRRSKRSIQYLRHRPIRRKQTANQFPPRTIERGRSGEPI